MGYWAKDGSYQYDDDDIRIKEASIREQGKSYGFFTEEKEPELTFSQRWVKQHEKEVQQQKQAEREYAARQSYQEHREMLEKWENNLEESRERAEQQRIAYNKAKARYNSLSIAQKVILKATGKDISRYSPSNSVATLDSLYNKGKSR